MYAHLLSSAGVRDDDRLFANENDESHFGGTITTPEISTKRSTVQRHRGHAFFPEETPRWLPWIPLEIPSPL